MHTQAVRLERRGLELTGDLLPRDAGRPATERPRRSCYGGFRTRRTHVYGGSGPRYGKCGRFVSLTTAGRRNERSGKRFRY